MLSIIIVNYNGLKFLRECLQAIAEHAACPHEVIIVDNASTDGSCSYIREHHPEVTLVVSEKNLGFAGGNNLGVAHAKGDLLLLLNNDTRLMSSLVPAIKAFEINGQLGVMGCMMSYGNGKMQPSMGYEHTPLRMVLSWVGLGRAFFVPSIFKRVDNNIKHYLSPREAAWVSGAFLMTRRVVWDRLGGLDESYFMYVEEVDYCRRVRDLGYRVAYTPMVHVIHYEGGGKIWLGKAALIYGMHSYINYMAKYYRPGTVVATRYSLSFVMALRSFAYLFKRDSVYREKCGAYWEASRVLFAGLTGPQKMQTPAV